MTDLSTTRTAHPFHFRSRPIRRVFALLSGVAIVGLAACSRDGSTPTGSDSGLKVLHFGNGTEIADLDPQVVTGTSEHKIIMALFEGLVTEDPVDLHPVPGVAESWDVSDDGRVYTFHLRTDARWSNGAPISAEDFLLSYKRMLTPALAAEYAGMLYDFVVNAKAYYDGTLTDFAQVGFRAIDPHTLEIRLTHPTPFFLRMLASHYSWWPVPVKVIERFGGLDRKGTAWTRPENFVCNGPFRLKSWVPNQKIVVERNPLHWDAANVKLDEIHFYPIESADTEERMFRTGQLDITNMVPLSKIDLYRKEKPDQIRIEPYLGSYFYRVNVTRPPFDDVRIRRAFALAIDRETLVREVTRGGQAPAYNFIPPGFPGYRPTARLTGTVEEAHQLLADAGFPGGRGLPPVEILYNTSEGHRTIAEALQRMWRVNLGAEVVLRNEEWKVYLDSQHALNYSLSRSGWIADYMHPHTFPHIFETHDGNNDTGWSNARYDTLHARSLEASTDEERFAIYDEMEKILVEELPLIPIYHYTRVYLMNPRVHGYHATPLDNHPWKSVSVGEPAASAAESP